MEPSIFFKSRRFWGMFIVAATAIFPAVGPFFGMTVNPALIIDLGVAGNDFLTAFGGFVGLILMFIGSLKAKGPMVLTN